MGGVVGLTGGLTGGDTGIVPAGSVPVACSTTDIINIEENNKVASCASAIAKIDDALSVSANFVAATSGHPSMAQINAVLSALEDSLDQCAPRHGTSDQRGLILDVGSSLDAEITSSDISSLLRESADRSVSTTTIIDLHSREVSCSECERELYGIVKQLRLIFSLGDTKDDGAIAKGTADAITSSTPIGNITEPVPVMNLRFANMLKEQAEVVKSAASDGEVQATATKMRRRVIGRMFGLRR